MPRSRLHFRDSILGCDFRKLFPLIEQMPSGFDCSLLRDGSPASGANNADGADAQEPDDDNHQQEADNHEGAAAAAAAEGDGDGDGDAAINQGAPAPAAAGGGVAARAPEEAEEKAGDFVMRGVRRRPAKRSLSPGVAAPAWASTATEEGQRPRSSSSSSSSSGDVALQVEFRGGLGVGNRCVRADLPLPSTVLRERTGAGARSSLARHLETSPLALFRWLLAKMAATASGGAGAGGGSDAGRASPASSASAVHLGLVGNHLSYLFQHNAQQQQAEGGAFAASGAMLQAGLGQDGAAATGERRRRASSLPSGGPDGAGASGGGQHGEKPKLPRVLCFPVALGRGVVDVTPRLVSYFEVTSVVGQEEIKGRGSFFLCVLCIAGAGRESPATGVTAAVRFHYRRPWEARRMR